MVNADQASRRSVSERIATRTTPEHPGLAPPRGVELEDLVGGERLDHGAGGVLVDLGLLGVERDRLVDPAEQHELLDLGRGLGVIRDIRHSSAAG